VTASATTAPSGATVALTITPDPGYELDAIHAYTANSTAVALSGNGPTRTFVMPAYAVTVTATFRKTQEQFDRETLREAKTSIEGGTYRIAQATGNTETAVKTWLADVLNRLLSGHSATVTTRSAQTNILAASVTTTSFTPATGGTEAKPSGTNGTFRFTVLLEKGSVQAETQQVNGTIVATPHAATPVKRIELLRLGETHIRIINTGNIETGALTVTLSGAKADAFALTPSTPGSLPAGGEADIRLIPREDLPPGIYTITVSGEALAPVSLEISYRALATGSETPAAPQVWTSGSTLYISTTTAGQARIFSAGGLLVKTIPHQPGETLSATLPRGFYIIATEEKRHKVILR
jgi:hypothetical protein